LGESRGVVVGERGGSLGNALNFHCHRHLALPLLLFRLCVVIQTQLKPAEEAQTTDSRRGGDFHGGGGDVI